MKHRAPALLVFALLTILIVGNRSFGLGADESYLPNYTQTLLPPVRDTDIPPQLVPARNHFPIRVALVGTSPSYPDYVSVVREACEAWTTATKSSSGPGIQFVYAETSSPNGGDILVVLGAATDFRGYSGFTSERGDYAYVRLACVDLDDKPVALSRLKRVAMHEIGHALGIWGHSPVLADIMSLDEGTSTITASDVNTLRWTYRHREDTGEDRSLCVP